MSILRYDVGILIDQMACHYKTEENAIFFQEKYMQIHENMLQSEVLYTTIPLLNKQIQNLLSQISDDESYNIILYKTIAEKKGMLEKLYNKPKFDFKAYRVENPDYTKYQSYQFLANY